MNRYYHQKPLGLPVHAIRCTVVASIGQEKTEHTFTALRSRASELLSLLVNVDFEKLVVVPVLYEFKSLEDFVSLTGPFHSSAVAADTSATVPYVSMWNTDGGHIREIAAPARCNQELLMLVKTDGDKEDEKALTRQILVERVEKQLTTNFNKLIIYPKDQTDTDEIPADKEDRLKRFSDMFEAVDLDESGEIVLEELRIVLKQKGYSDDFVEHIFCHLDINKDFRIKREEFYEALKFIPHDIFTSDRALSDDHLLRYFDDFDTEKKGEVSWDQFHAALLKRGLTDAFIKTYFAQMDLDASKAITRNEYKRCIGLRWTSND